MTHATLGDPNRHDTLAPVTSRSGRGTARQTIRIDETLWEQFGEQVPDGNRSDVIRDFIRWYIRDQGAKMPKRPPALPGDVDLPPGMSSYKDGVTRTNPLGQTWYEFRTVMHFNAAILAIVDTSGPGIATDNSNRVFGRSRVAVENAYCGLREAGYLIEGVEAGE